MNVAMVVYSHYSRDARVRRYAETLARGNHQIDIICLSENYHPKEKNIRLFMFPMRRRRLGRLWYLVEYLFFSLYALILLSMLSLFKNYKLVHIHNMPDILVATAIIPKILGGRIILDMHDPMPELYMSKYHAKENDFIAQLLKWLEKISFQFADSLITANEEFKRIFLERKNCGENKISVILNCPDKRIFHPEPRTNNQERFTLFYMGTVDKRFGLDIVIEAIPNLAKHITNLRFIIVPKLENEGKYFDNLEFRIKNSELEKYIKILPPQPLEKIVSMLTQANIGIVLAKNGVFTENIFPVKLLEFIQMNIPVIASKTKILAKYFDDKSVYFLKKNSPEEFSKAVTTLWKNKNLGKSLAANAKNYLKKYNWEKEEKKYLRLVENIDLIH